MDVLAGMVAKGFEDVASKMATKEELRKMATKTDVKNLKIELQLEIRGLRNAVNNYLELSDKRYLELKRQNTVLVKYIKLIVQKGKLPINVGELEKIH